ncbi:unnamed protein product, partial [Cuscuta epithymum]
MEYTSSQNISLELTLAPPKPSRTMPSRSPTENLISIEDSIILSKEKNELDQELFRVPKWKNWRMSPINILTLTASYMQPEEQFALGWLRTKSIEKAISIDYIKKIYQRRLNE